MRYIQYAGWACSMLESIDIRGSIDDNAQIKASSNINPASRVRFHDNRSRLFASKYLQWVYIVHNVVGFMEISTSQQFLTHDKIELIMTFVAQELPQFSIKRFILQNILKFCNIRSWPIKNSSVAHRLRNPALKGSFTSNVYKAFSQIYVFSQCVTLPYDNERTQLLLVLISVFVPVHYCLRAWAQLGGGHGGRVPPTFSGSGV